MCEPCQVDEQVQTRLGPHLRGGQPIVSEIRCYVGPHLRGGHPSVPEIRNDGTATHEDAAGQLATPPRYSRRKMLGRSLTSIAGLTCADFLSYFAAFGMPDESKATRMSADATRAADNPRFLVYWYLEGGWCGYDMFNPVNTENNVIKR
ncbi:MAG: hypothetical protein ABL921_29380, partial [Pirellula sp.]